MSKLTPDKIAKLLRRKPIRSRRPETAKQDRIYNARVKEWLKLPENEKCWCCVVRSQFEKRQIRRATNCHHSHGRGWRRELMMVEGLWIPCCSECHPAWIDSHKEEARELGLLAPKGEWNRMPSFKCDGGAMLKAATVPSDFPPIKIGGAL